MTRGLHRLRRAVLLLALLAAAGGAGAVQRALLVGVSELANQPASLWLQAPRNDVVLMRRALAQQGFAAADITVLADGVDGAALPESQRIHEALARLLAQSADGDFVLLYFSGHGTRWRDATKRYAEPDGLAENFLARDVRGAIGSGAPLPGGLRDVDIDGWVQAFLARGVFVGAVFDTCSAASLTRGREPRGPAAAQPADDEVRFRGIRADLLAQGDAAAPAAAMTPPPAPAVPRARYVALFASESHQVTPELRLPRMSRRAAPEANTAGEGSSASREAQPHGLLTWAVVEALRRRPATWRELFDEVLALYPPVIAELEARFPERELPSPVAEGQLDAPLFANAAQPLATRPVWRAQRSGASLAVQAGLLDGLVPQQPLRVLASLEDGSRRSAAAVLSQLDLDSAQLPLPAALRELPGSALWSVTPQDEPAAYALRVRADRPLPAGLSLDYPASVRPAAAGEEADLRWTDLGAAGHRLDPLSPAAGLPAGVQAADTAALRERLQALARLKWFQALAGLAADARLDGFDARLELWRADRLLRSEPLVRGSAPPLPQPGERLALQVRNTGGSSLDMVIVGIDGQGGLHAVYPDAIGASNRFERGTREAPAVQRFELPWLAGGGRLLVLATPAAPHSASRLFGAGLDHGLADLRLRGLSAPARPRQAFAAMLQWPGDAAPHAK
jgi:hypothetical protein